MRSILKPLRARYGDDGDAIVEHLHHLAFDCPDPQVQARMTAYLADQFWGKARETVNVTASVVPVFALPEGAVVNVIEADDDDPPKQLEE